MKNTYLILGIGVVVLAGGGIAFYLYNKKKKEKEEEEAEADIKQKRESASTKNGQTDYIKPVEVKTPKVDILKPKPSPQASPERPNPCNDISDAGKKPKCQRAYNKGLYIPDGVEMRGQQSGNVLAWMYHIKYESSWANKDTLDMWDLAEAAAFQRAKQRHEEISKKNAEKRNAQLKKQNECKNRCYALSAARSSDRRGLLAAIQKDFGLFSSKPPHYHPTRGRCSIDCRSKFRLY